MHGVLLCSSLCQAFDGPTSLLFSCQCWCVGRELMVMAPPPYTRLNSISFLQWLPGFTPQAFLTTASSLTSPLCLSTVSIRPHPVIPSQSPNSRSQASIQGPRFLSRVCVKDCLILILLFQFCIVLYLLVSGQFLRSTVSWCSLSMSVSKGLFLIHL